MLNINHMLSTRTETLLWPEYCRQQVGSRWTCTHHSCRGS